MSFILLGITISLLHLSQHLPLFTGSALLVEFGIVASLNVMITFAISLLLIPIFFSFLKVPQEKDLAHFESKKVTKVLTNVEKWVFYNRKGIYAIVFGIVLIGIYGITKIKAIG